MKVNASHLELWDCLLGRSGNGCIAGAKLAKIPGII
jgi:hypothetical protein